jgi:3-phosphoshikimate 1-carboxyvinyltransferase
MGVNTTIESIVVKKHKGEVKCTVTPPSSKSESNRVLIINALTGLKGDLQNLSNARDTQTMIRLLKSTDKTLDVLDAGTTMRFLTAYTAITGRETILTGTERMKQRPIKLLVDALRTLGASVDYLENDGCPPIEIKKFDKANVKTNHLKIRGDVSSQYITALLMTGAVLPQGLVLELEGKIGSKPYIQMTLELMKHFGVTAVWKDNIIEIPHQEYKPATYSVESDWTAASYWYAVVAMAEKAEVEILGYKDKSFQGDRACVEIFDKLGVKSTFTANGLKLTKKEHAATFEYDFTDSPDVAQTVAVVCAAKGITGTLSGLESLRIKETDRIAALQTELAKFGADVVEVEKDVTYKVVPGKFAVNGQSVATYKDHRMAMAFAPLALFGELTIEKPEVVDKSYPHYWDDLKVAGFELN